jgi:multidrug resistance efflux pump
MADDGRSPRLGFGIMMLLLVGSVAGTAWWLNRPAPTPPPGPPAEDADVFCTGRVDAAGRVTSLEPAHAGRVVKVLVAEGATVEAGQPLVRLDAAAAELRLIQAEAAVEAARVELDLAVRDKGRVPNQIAAREALVRAAAARVEAARKLLQPRQEQQKVTPLGRAEQDAMEAQIRQLEQMELAQHSEVDDLKKLNPDLRIRAARAKLTASEADRDWAAKGKADCVVTAPGPGTILRLSVAVGGLMVPGSPAPAVVFAPAGPLVVRAEVDQESLGRVEVGMTAEVRDENRPEGRVWKGHVKRVAQWVAQRRTHILEPGEINDIRTLECVIELDSPTDGLWIGQRMRVRIIRGPERGSGTSGAASR